MKSEQIVMCVVAFILGMLLVNMLKSVCGCKVVEGQDCTGGSGFLGNLGVTDRIPGTPEACGWPEASGYCCFDEGAINVFEGDYPDQCREDRDCAGAGCWVTDSSKRVDKTTGKSNDPLCASSVMKCQDVWGGNRCIQVPGVAAGH